MKKVILKFISNLQGILNRQNNKEKEQSCKVHTIWFNWLQSYSNQNGVYSTEG